MNCDSIELMETTQDSFDYSELENPMDERSKDALRLNFDRFSIKLPRKRKSLPVQGDFDKTIDIGKTELCFLSV